MACFLTKLKNSTIKRKNDILNMFDNKTIKEPIKPFAFIRAFNEIKTIKASLDSIVGVIDKGVIVYHMDDDGADDGTENVILSFCKQNQGFKAIKYPHKIAPPGADWGGDLNKRLDTYYNFCLLHIPKKSWLIKIDTDHIYSQTALKDVINSAKKTYHSIYLPAINMHFDGKDLYFLKDTLKIGYDHWLIYNQNLSFEYDGVMEILKINRTNYRQKSQHIVSLHFPLMKKSRNATKDNLIPYDDFDIDAFAKKHLLTQEDIDFLKNKQKIISFFNT